MIPIDETNHPRFPPITSATTQTATTLSQTWLKRLLVSAPDPIQLTATVGPFRA